MTLQTILSSTRTWAGMVFRQTMPPFAFCGLGARFEAETVASSFDDLAVAGQPIEELGEHPGVTKGIGHGAHRNNPHAAETTLWPAAARLLMEYPDVRVEP